MIIKEEIRKKRNKKVKNDYEGKIKCKINTGYHQKFRCCILGGTILAGSPPASSTRKWCGQLKTTKREIRDFMI